MQCLNDKLNPVFALSKIKILNIQSFTFLNINLLINSTLKLPPPNPPLTEYLVTRLYNFQFRRDLWGEKQLSKCWIQCFYAHVASGSKM